MISSCIFSETDSKLDEDSNGIFTETEAIT